MQRVAIKRMLADWERDFPGRTETIFSALRNVELDHLADTRKFDFAGLDARRTAQMTGAGVEPPAPEVALPLPKPGGFMSASEGSTHASTGQSRGDCPGPSLSGLMSAQEEAELDDRLESLAISA